MYDYSPRSSGRRPAFTLIELLVVIAIIAILAALIVVGVNGVMKSGPLVQNRNDILNISVALDKFKAKYKFYPPSQLKLHARYNQYNQAIAIDAQSLAYISAMWPNIIWTQNPAANIAWAGATPIPNGGFFLEGDQCLVFFLGGIPNGTNPPLGFSNNPLDPSAAGGDRIKWMEFDGGRIISRGGSAFPSYRDAYPAQGPTRPAMPFVYFSAGKHPNGYDTVNALTGTTPVNTLGVSPYMDTAATFYLPTKFQLISSGLDGKFGPGGAVWPPIQPPNGNDDMSNFSDKLLGSP